jgi:hypothetical protein
MKSLAVELHRLEILEAESANGAGESGWKSIGKMTKLGENDRLPMILQVS